MGRHGKLRELLEMRGEYGDNMFHWVWTEALLRILLKALSRIGMCAADSGCARCASIHRPPGSKYPRGIGPLIGSFLTCQVHYALFNRVGHTSTMSYSDPGNTPLMNLIDLGRRRPSTLAMIKLMVKAGADPRLTDNANGGHTALDLVRKQGPPFKNFAQHFKIIHYLESLAST